MARDKRTYRFLKDTRLGRVVLAESQDVEDVADSVTHYLAERIIEREKAMESDFLLTKMGDEAINEDAARKARLAKDKEHRGSNGLWWFLFGVLAGAVGLVPLCLVHACRFLISILWPARFVRDRARNRDGLLRDCLDMVG